MLSGFPPSAIQSPSASLVPEGRFVGRKCVRGDKEVGLVQWAGRAAPGSDLYIKKKTEEVFQLSPFQYPDPGSNRDGLPHWCLRPARLPIPPSGQLLFLNCECKGNAFFYTCKGKCIFFEKKL